MLVRLVVFGYSSYSALAVAVLVPPILWTIQSVYLSPTKKRIKTLGLKLVLAFRLPFVANLVVWYRLYYFDLGFSSIVVALVGVVF